MSHISNFDADVENERMIATPAPEQIGRTVRDFLSRKDAVATPRRFIGNNQSILASARKLNFAPDIIAGVEEDDYGEATKNLTGRVWKIYKVSPLFGFDENVEDMILKLQDHLQNDIDKVPTLQAMSYSNEDGNVDNDNDTLNNAINNRERQWFEVSVKVVKGLRGNRDDKEALLLQIKQSSNKANGMKKEKICATCYLLSVDAKEASFYSKNVAQLPLCLACGDSELIKHVHEGLRRRFDCTIYPLEIPEEELMWMSALWSSIQASAPNNENNRDAANINNTDSVKKRKMSENNQQPEQSQQIDNLQTENELIPEKGDKIVLRFQLAEDKKIPGLDHIDVTFEGAQIRKLWSNFHKNKGSQESEITQEEMETFHKALRTHARNTLKLCLDDRSIFILTQVWLPILSVSNVGKIRVDKGCNNERIKSILRELTTLCQGTTLTANPRIGYEDNVDPESDYQ